MVTLRSRPGLGTRAARSRVQHTNYKPPPPPQKKKKNKKNAWPQVQINIHHIGLFEACCVSFPLLSYFFVKKKYLLVGASGMLWTGGSVTERCMYFTPIRLDLLLNTNQICCCKGKWYVRRFDPDTVQSVKPWSQGWLIAAGAYPSFCSMKRLEVFLLPLDGMLVHRSSLPRNFVRFPQQIAGTHLYTWVEKGNVRVKCLAQEHNTLSPDSSLRSQAH